MIESVGSKVFFFFYINHLKFPMSIENTNRNLDLSLISRDDDQKTEKLWGKKIHRDKGWWIGVHGAFPFSPTQVFDIFLDTRKERIADSKNEAWFRTINPVDKMTDNMEHVE